MAVSAWQRRIHRAQEVGAEHSFAAEILGFYIHLARFQEKLNQHLSKAFPVASASISISPELGPAELLELNSSFGSFLSVVETHGPKPLAELSRNLCARGKDFWSDLLSSAWIMHSLLDAQGLLAFAFLQPYAELLRSRASLRPTQHTYALCPFCNRKPGFGVLRQMGDGGARFLVCAFCLAEWEFRRIVCPGCGEESDKNLPVFIASDFDYIRVEGCDSCKTYIKSVDLTKNGRADPLVDELASAPLDLWARDHGFAKLQSNILGM